MTAMERAAERAASGNVSASTACQQHCLLSPRNHANKQNQRKPCHPFHRHFL